MGAGIRRRFGQTELGGRHGGDGGPTAHRQLIALRDAYPGRSILVLLAES